MSWQELLSLQVHFELAFSPLRNSFPVGTYSSPLGLQFSWRSALEDSFNLFNWRNSLGNSLNGPFDKSKVVKLYNILGKLLALTL